MIPQPPQRGRWRRLKDTLASVPRAVLVRFLIFVGLLAAGVALLRYPPVAQHLERENILALLETMRAYWWSPLALLGIYWIGGTLGMPASPLVVAGGAVFGVAYGSFLNLTGLLIAACFSFFLGRFFGRELVQHIAGDRLRRAERLFDRRGFWPLVSLRFLPMPFPVINYGAALAGVRPSLFVVSSLIGLAPANLMHTFFAARMATAAEGQRWWIGAVWIGCWALIAFLTTLPTLRDARRRRLRYRELTAVRRNRRSETLVSDRASVNQPRR